VRYKLTYTLVTEPTLIFEAAPDVHSETDELTVHLSRGTVTVELKIDVSSEGEARRLADAYLHGWEIEAALELGQRELWFEFDRLEPNDGVPPAPPEHLMVSLKDRVTVADRLTIIITSCAYPAPPKKFVVSPDVETMWSRYNGHCEGREPLPSTAYMCLTVLEASAGGRQEAARRYGIAPKVLRMLGYLPSEIGDAQTARKRSSQHQHRRHTQAERNWMVAVIKAMIRRAGEMAFDPSQYFSELTMKDFPPL
jgi:hypothetical protein